MLCVDEDPILLFLTVMNKMLALNAVLNQLFLRRTLFMVSDYLADWALCTLLSLLARLGLLIV